MARPRGSLNKRSQGLLKLLEDDYDLHPVRKMAETIQREVPLVIGGEIVTDTDGKPVMVPYLGDSAMVSAIGKLLDKTFPTLQAQKIEHSGDGLPLVMMDMMGLTEDTKPARKRAPKKDK